MYNGVHMSGKAGRPRKAEAEKVVNIGFRVKPPLRKNIEKLARNWNENVSETARRLVVAGFVALERREDAMTQRLLDAWRHLTVTDRGRLITIAEIFAGTMARPIPPNITPLAPDPYEGGTFPDDVPEYDDGPPER